MTPEETAKFDGAWKQIMAGDVLPASEALMKKICQAFFLTGRLSYCEEIGDQIGSTLKKLDSIGSGG